jgi:hypothetical protein
MLTKFGSKTAKDTRVHNILAKDLMQQAPWKYKSGQRFATLKKREADKIEHSLNEEARSRIEAAAQRRVAMYGAMLRQREERERSCMEHSEDEMRRLMAEEAAIQAKKDAIKARRAPALKRLGELKALEAKRARDQVRERLAREAERRVIAAEIEAKRAKEERFRKQLEDLAAFSPYTSEVKENKPPWAKGGRPSIDYGMLR